MGNFRRHHAKKPKGRNKKKSLHRKEDENRRAEDEQMAGDQAGVEVVVVDVHEQERENKKEKMVLLLCTDGVELVVPKEEASRYGRTIEMNIKYDDYDNAYIRDISIGNRGYSLISLSVESDVLSIVIHYSYKKHHDPGWDAAEFVAGFDHPTLFRIILAAKDLENRDLLSVACRAVSDMIANKSQRKIRAMFGIRPPPAAAGRSTLQQLARKITPDDQTQSTMMTLELELEKRALGALHIVRCQDFTAYDPKRRAFWHTRFCGYNIAFFDFDKESRFGRGLPLHRVRESSTASSSVNIISLKVRESDVGFPISVFDTVIARDMIDYRCVYLFRRDADDSQLITSPDDMLTLMDQHRGLVPEDVIYFEINLWIKCDGDFSRGLTSFNICRLRRDNETTNASLTSWLSRVELEIAHVPRPLEASITVNILKGPCELTRVAAWTSGSTEARIILYDSEAATRTHITKTAYSIALARRVVFVPLGEKLVLNLVGHDEDEPLVLTLRHCDDEYHSVCKMGITGESLLDSDPRKSDI